MQDVSYLTLVADMDVILILFYSRPFIICVFNHYQHNCHKKYSSYFTKDFSICKLSRICLNTL